jgi:signal transduction histidine kinase
LNGVYLLAFSKSFETLRIHHDIRVRSRERVQQRLRQAEKLEAIGRISGGVAHDFNNILTAIQGGIDLAALSIGSDDPASADLDVAREGVSAGQDVVRQLLDLAQSHESEPEKVDVAEFLSDSKRLLSMVVPSGIQLELDVKPRTGCVSMSRGRLTQVLMNLVVNACDAMPDGGRVTVGARRSARPGSNASDLVVSVVDEGKGMPPEVLKHVFEPFFSTKVEEGGTGLGLATLHRIVTEAGGHVEVESELGRGTSFHVFLPRLANGGDALPEADPSAQLSFFSGTPSV